MVRHQKLAGTTGFEPAISSVTGKHVRPGYTTAPHYKTWKRRRESNSRIKTLQVSTLPLGYAASSHLKLVDTGGFEPLLSRCKRDAFPVMLPAHFCWLRDTLQRAVYQIKLKLPNHHLVHLIEGFILGVGGCSQPQRWVPHLVAPILLLDLHGRYESNNALSAAFHIPSILVHRSGLEPLIVVL